MRRATSKFSTPSMFSKRFLAVFIYKSLFCGGQSMMPLNSKEGNLHSFEILYSLSVLMMGLRSTILVSESIVISNSPQQNSSVKCCFCRISDIIEPYNLLNFSTFKLLGVRDYASSCMGAYIPLLLFNWKFSVNLIVVAGLISKQNCSQTLQLKDYQRQAQLE